MLLLNETFAPIGGSMKGRKEKATGVLWHEAIKERSAPDVASTYIKVIRENRDIIHSIFCWIIARGKTKIGICTPRLLMKSIQKTALQKPPI